MRQTRVQIVAPGANHLIAASFRHTKTNQLELESLEVIANRGDLLETLQLLTGKLHDSGSIHVVLPGHLSLTKLVRTPAIARAKRAKIAEFEASQAFPKELGELEWAYAVTSEEAGTLEIMLVAAKAERLAAWCAAAESARLKIASMSPAGFCLRHAFAHAYPEITGTVVVVAVGERTTDVAIVDGPRCVSRTVQVGTSSAIGAESPEELSKTVARLSGELAKSLAALAQQISSAATQIYLQSSTPSFELLAATVAARTDLPVERFDPLRRVVMTDQTAADIPEIAGQQISGVVGLAAAQLCASNFDHVDLSPKALRTQRDQAVRRPWQIAAAALLLLSLVAPAQHYRHDVRAVTLRLSEVQTRVNAARALAHRNSENLARLESAKREIARFVALDNGRSAWAEFLADLETRITANDDVWLEKLSAVSTGDAATQGGPVSATARGELLLSGCIVDRLNPRATVSPESAERARQLVSELGASPFVAKLENEHFDNSLPGILRFDVTLIPAGTADL